MGSASGSVVGAAAGASAASEGAASPDQYQIDLTGGDDFPIDHWELLRSDETKNQFYNIAAAYLNEKMQR